MTVLERYDFTQFSARSLTVFDGAVYFVENPSYSYQFRPINPDLEGWHESLCYNLLPENDGALKRITSAGVVEDQGRIWYGDTAYRGVPMPCLVIEDSLNIVANYARTDDLLRLNADGSVNLIMPNGSLMATGWIMCCLRLLYPHKASILRYRIWH